MKVQMEDVNNIKALFGYIKVLSDDGFSPEVVGKIKEMLNYAKPFFKQLILEESFPELIRLTINKKVLGDNKRIKEINHIKYPPPHKVGRYGRCNLPGQSILYAGFLKPTILNELKPDSGDMITTSLWKVKDEQKMFYCPVFLNQPTDGTFNIRSEQIRHFFEKTINKNSAEEKELIRFMSQFVADAFSKNVSSNNDLDYFLSAYFSSIIFNEMKYGQVEAICYPSVQEKLAFENIAIKPEIFDRKYELQEVSDVIVIESCRSGNRRYHLHGIGSTRRFDLESNTILWDENEIALNDKIQRIEREHNIKI